MTLPSNERCVKILEDLEDDPALTQWEADFIASNRGRTTFTDRQREIIAAFEQKYEV